MLPEALHSRELMAWRFASTLLLLCIFSPTRIAFGQSSEQFNASSYPAGSFKISHRAYPFGSFTVRIIQVKGLNDATTNPSYCRAWLQVRSGGRTVRQAYFKDIDPVGADYGIFLPEKQSIPNYFVALKDGDYDGRLLFIGKDGSLTDLPGGAFFLTPDKRYVVGSHDSDYQSPFVIDLSNHRLVINGSKENLPSVDQWYRDRHGYFFTVLDNDGTSHKPIGKKLDIYRLNLAKLKFTKSSITVSQLKSARKVQTVPWQQSPDCTSLP